MHTQEAKVWFHDHLRDILTSLYDPAALRKSPLIQVLDLSDRRNEILSLRETLCQAIESLRPTPQTPRDTKIWRNYQILRRRYIEQVSQHGVALDLGLSKRQLQRDEVSAREMLLEYLWDKFDLETKFHERLIHSEEAVEVHSPAKNIPSREQEIEYLYSTAQELVTNLDVLIHDVIKTLNPLLHANQATMRFDTLQSNIQVYSKPLLLRQALINVVSTILQCANDGQPQITVTCATNDNLQNITLHMSACLSDQTAIVVDATNDLEMARRLIHLCGGQIDVQFEPSRDPFFVAEILLPMEAPATVMVIDDNADTRQLFGRYLDHTRYHFVGVAGGKKVLTEAVQQQPSLIVLDVMMPEQDGWEILSYLRQHPETENIPVIVCTILAQESLAYALGAAGFIRKPVSREQFLETLTQQMIQPT